jgi:hypothetical protein
VLRIQKRFSGTCRLSNLQHSRSDFSETKIQCAFVILGTDDVLSETTMDGILYLEDEFDKVWQNIRDMQTHLDWGRTCHAIFTLSLTPACSIRVCQTSSQLPQFLLGNWELVTDLESSFDTPKVTRRLTHHASRSYFVLGVETAFLRAQQKPIGLDSRTNRF